MYWHCTSRVAITSLLLDATTEAHNDQDLTLTTMNTVRDSTVFLASIYTPQQANILPRKTKKRDTKPPPVHGNIHLQNLCIHTYITPACFDSSRLTLVAMIVRLGPACSLLFSVIERWTAPAHEHRAIQPSSTGNISVFILPAWWRGGGVRLLLSFFFPVPNYRSGVFFYCIPSVFAL